MRQKVKQFWQAPLLNKAYMLSTLYYKVKGIIFYRLIFKQFGKGSYIRRPVLIFNPQCINIGERVSVRDGVRLEVVPSYDGSAPCLSIGDDTNLEQNVHIVCHCRIRIGKRVSITGHCAIVDVSHPYHDVQDATKVGLRIKNEESYVEIGDGTFVGYGSVILPNVRLGKNVVVGANSVVTADIPDYSVAAGAPAIVIKQYDRQRNKWVRTSVKESIRAAEL